MLTDQAMILTLGLTAQLIKHKTKLQVCVSVKDMCHESAAQWICFLIFYFNGLFQWICQHFFQFFISMDYFNGYVSVFVFLFFSMDYFNGYASMCIADRR